MSGPQLRHVGLNLRGTDLLEPGEAAIGVYGFWIFLMSDAILFALLFALYGTQLAATAGAPGPQAEFKIGPAFVETLILLTSSLTFGFASIAMKYDRTSTGLVVWLGVTLALGIAFLGFELNDFRTMISDGATPDRSGFLSALFALVPTHGLHVTAGCAWITVMLAQIAVFGLDDRVKLNLLRLGLFWHFLDVVWIGIFSVVYLQGHSDERREPDESRGAGESARSRRCDRRVQSDARARTPDAERRRTFPVAHGRPSDDDAHSKRVDLATYAIGYVLALALTGLAFGLVYWRWATARTAFGIVLGLALVQALVHLRCFLHIDLTRSSRDDRQLILFSTLIILLMVGGTMVVLFNLRMRMM